MLGFIRQFLTFFVDMLQSRRLIFDLAKRDFQYKYLGSYFGILWAFIQPTITIIIFWFVFQIGFKSIPIDNFPFILWLLCGMIPWFFFSEALANATNAVIENSYLVKKVVFRVSILPVIKILSAFFIHLFFIIVLVFIFLIYGYRPSIYTLQVIYYLFATFVLVLGLSWITSALVVFLKDVGQIVAMLLQFGFWITPIFWSLKIVPQSYHGVFKLNPLFYIVEGYRDTFIYHKWFWEHTHQTPYFWGVTLLLFITGAAVFKRLRPHFADVL